MRGGSQAATVLVIEPDVVLGQILGKVLASPGRTVIHAAQAPQALQLAEQHAPRVLLLDGNPRGDRELELATHFLSRYAGLPLILLGAKVPQPEVPPDATRSVRVLPKPLDLQELRRAVDAALAEETAATACPPPPASPRRPWSLAKEFVMRAFLTKLVKVACVVVIVGAVLAGFAMAIGVVPVPWQGQDKAPVTPRPKAVQGHLAR